MRSLSLLPLPLLLLAAAQLSLADRERFRPYEILGVKRSASPEEIKKGYRRLVKELHPDKNKAPDAEDKFVRLTKAYELLSDPERRRMYDNHGVTEDTPNFNKKHDYSQYNRHGDPFDHLRDVFGDSFHSFRSGNARENIFHKQSITYRAVSMFSRMANRMIEISEILYDRVTLFSQVSSALVFS